MKPIAGYLAVMCAAIALAGPAPAEEAEAAFGGRETLGWGRIFNNDYIGDSQDRWQTGSYFVSMLRGPGWEGALPARPFEVMEYRFGLSIVAPSDLVTPAVVDRRYAGRLHFMAASHWQMRGLETRLGLGLVAVGPDTGVSGLHGDLHDLLSMPQPLVADDQLGNKIYPVLSAELGREFALGGAALRPFAEARLGDEDFVRLGVDLAFAGREPGALWLRDEITGQRYAGISGTAPQGVAAFTLGADLAHVFDSAYFPKADSVDFEPTRYRLRAGVSTRIGLGGLFYGLTYLSEEFKGQPEGQVLGSLRMRLVF